MSLGHTGDNEGVLYQDQSSELGARDSTWPLVDADLRDVRSPEVVCQALGRQVDPVYAGCAIEHTEGLRRDEPDTHSECVYDIEVASSSDARTARNPAQDGLTSRATEVCATRSSLLMFLVVSARASHDATKVASHLAADSRTAALPD